MESENKIEKIDRIISLASGTVMVLSFLRRGRGLSKLVTGGLLVHRGLMGVSPQYREAVERIADKLFQPSGETEKPERKKIAEKHPKAELHN